MIPIPANQIPALPMQDIIAGECVAWGVGDTGIMIHYVEKDKAVLIEWEDIVKLGIAPVPATEPAQEVEIDGPTKTD